MEYTHFVSVAGFVLNSNDEVLLINSPDRGWEYPGGMVEPGENLSEALIREIKEETGVYVEITSFVGISVNLQKNIVNIDFVCRYIDGELKTSEESIDVKWIKKDKIFDYVSFPLTRTRLEKMLSKSDKVSVFGFNKEPFEVIADDELIVGC